MLIWGWGVVWYVSNNLYFYLVLIRDSLILKLLQTSFSELEFRAGKNCLKIQHMQKSEAFVYFAC